MRLEARRESHFHPEPHGAGSYGNWQRHYFPILDYAQKYRLVIATPNAPSTVWTAADDVYLQNIVKLVYDQVGKKNIKAFWLVGHSQGGMTSNRLVRTDFFKSRVDGWLSLSGGRLGPTPPIPASFFAAVQGNPPGVRDAAPLRDHRGNARRGAIPAAPQGLPDTSSPSSSKRASTNSATSRFRTRHLGHQTWLPSPRS